VGTARLDVRVKMGDSGPEVQVLNGQGDLDVAIAPSKSG
jgi:hypothetical protein